MDRLAGLAATPRQRLRAHYELAFLPRWICGNIRNVASELPQRGLAAFSVCQNALSNEGMQSDLDMVVEAGTSAVALLGSVVQETGLPTTTRLLAERNLTVSSYMSTIRILELDFDECIDVLVRAIEAAAAVHAPILLIGSGRLGTLTVREADETVVARLKSVSSRARDHGVTLALEPVHPFLRTVGYVHTVSHSVDIVRQVPGAGVVLDVAHVYWDRHVYDDIAESAAYICSVQLTNLSPAGIDERRWVRCALDQGVIPVEAMIRSLDQAGFAGYYEDEILGSTNRRECLTGVMTARNWFAALCAEAGGWT